MGYCMDQGDTKFNIAKENRAKALQAIKALAGKETIADGSGKHFSWVNTAEFLNASTLEEALEAWRWDCNVGMGVDHDLGGDITDIEFTGEKFGDDLLLFQAIAPWVQAGSYITMRGEGGDVWRWYFDGTTCREQTGRYTFDD